MRFFFFKNIRTQIRNKEGGEKNIHPKKRKDMELSLPQPTSLTVRPRKDEGSECVCLCFFYASLSFLHSGTWYTQKGSDLEFNVFIAEDCCVLIYHLTVPILTSSAQQRLETGSAQVTDGYCRCVCGSSADTFMFCSFGLCRNTED